jgi:myo-inositol-1(or 4)-monophosphatase
MNNDANRAIEELSAFALETILAAGREAAGFYGRNRTSVKFDEDLVTQAELHLRSFFQQRLPTAFPGHQVFPVQDPHAGYSHGEQRYLWVFDPIDGVDNFQAGIPVWSMSLALYENFWPIFGYVHMPASGDLFSARAGENAFWGSQPIGSPPRETVDDESQLLVYSRFHKHFTARFPGKIRNLGCAAAHLCYVAMGRADAAVINNESFQDLAAVRIIVEGAGAKIFRMDGAALPIGEYLGGEKISEPLIVCAPENFEPVRQCLIPVGR